MAHCIPPLPNRCSVGVYWTVRNGYTVTVWWPVKTVHCVACVTLAVCEAAQVLVVVVVGDWSTLSQMSHTWCRLWNGLWVMSCCVKQCGKGKIWTNRTILLTCHQCHPFTYLVAVCCCVRNRWPGCTWCLTLEVSCMSLHLICTVSSR